MAESQTDRLAADLAALEVLEQQSSVFSFTSQGQPPEYYEVVFRGRGVTRDAEQRDEREDVTVHRCELRLSNSYPHQPPQIRWITEIFHPNVSFGGLVRPEDIGIDWTPEIGLDVICDRLWEVARWGYVDLDRPTNHAAENWLAEQEDFQRPTDTRPLRDLVARGRQNIVRYARREDGAVGELEAPTREDEFFIGDETHYIGNDTPAPDEPAARAESPAQPHTAETSTPPRREPPEDDVLYIGYEE